MVRVSSISSYTMHKMVQASSLEALNARLVEAEERAADAERRAGTSTDSVRPFPWLSQGHTAHMASGQHAAIHAPLFLMLLLGLTFLFVNGLVACSACNCCE